MTFRSMDLLRKQDEPYISHSVTIRTAAPPTGQNLHHSYTTCTPLHVLLRF